MYEDLYRGIYGGLNPYAQPDLNALIAQAQKLQSQNPYNPANQPNQAMTNRGDYVVIKDYKEVETTPARADGIATLFFDYANMIFYSKKLLNGKAVVQNFNFSIPNAIQDGETTPQGNGENAPTEPKNDKIDILLDYVEKIENRLNSAVKEINKLKKSNKVVEGNEI